MGNEIVKAGEQKIGAGGLVPFLTENADRIAEAATFKIDTRKAIQVCGAICSTEKNRKMLAECTNASFLNALRQCVSFGLMPTPATDMGYFIPYRDKEARVTEVQFKLGWRGILELARRCGVHAVAKVIYRGDKFTYRDGLNPEILHEPDLTGPREDKDIVCAYSEAVWTGEDGTQRKAVEVMTKAEIDMVRSKAAQGSGAWKDFYAEMARKTVLRRASKWWPLSTEAVEAIGVDSEGEFDFSRRPARGRAETPQGAIAADVRAAVEAEVIEPEDEGINYSDAAEVMKQTIEEPKVNPEAVEEMVAFHCGKIRAAGSAGELAKLIDVAGQSIPKKTLSKEQKDRLNAAVVETRKDLELKEVFGD